MRYIQGSPRWGNRDVALLGISIREALSAAERAPNLSIANNGLERSCGLLCFEQGPLALRHILPVRLFGASEPVFGRFQLVLSISGNPLRRRRSRRQLVTNNQIQPSLLHQLVFPGHVSSPENVSAGLLVDTRRVASDCREDGRV